MSGENASFYENFVEDHSFASFIRRMAQSGTWAEHTVLNALTHVLNMTVVVINSDDAPPIILKKPQARGIVYLVYEVNQHYHLLQRDLSIVPEKALQALIDRTPALEAPASMQANVSTVGTH